MSRTPTNNPFEPGADRIPPVWAGRQPELSDWRDRLRPRRAGGQAERGRTLLGEPGIGKSVLVRRIAADATDQGDWVTPQVRIPRGVDPIPLVAEAVLDLADQAGLTTRVDTRIRGLLDRLRQVSVMGTGMVLGAGEGTPPHLALKQVLVEVARAARPDGRVVLVHLDEVQNVVDEEQRSQLLIAFGDALALDEPVTVPSGRRVSAGLPLVVYLTGLPEFHDQATSRSGATFARRFATALLDPMSDEDLYDALHPFVRDGWPVLTDDGPTRVWLDEAGADALVATCHGDPFLFQLAGQHAWDAGTGEVVEAGDVFRGWTRARPEARRHVERLLERLPDLERSFVEAMAALDPESRTLTNIARELGYEQASQIGPTSQRLDTVRGIVDRGPRYTFRARTVEAYLTGGWP